MSHYPGIEDVLEEDGGKFASMFLHLVIQDGKTFLESLFN
jgi:hypothetical protein